MKRIYTFLAALMCLAGTNAWAEGYDALTIVGGVAQISSAADWDNFVIAVNTDKHYNLNAVLTHDITLTDPVTITAGSTYASSSKYTGNGYTGTFDGQFHTLTYTKTTTAAGWGLFARLYGGTIKNLNVAGTLTANHTCSAGLVNTVSGTSLLQNVNVGVNTISNTAVTHGGIARLVDGEANFIGCVYSGTITGTKTTNCNAFAYNNYNTSNFINCAVISTFGPNDTGSYIMLRGSNATQRARCSNCYYLSTISGPSVNTGSATITAEKIASGFLAEQLNLDQTFPAAWRQTLGADAAPVLDPDHGIVNKVSAAGYTTQYIADCDVEIPSGVTAYAGSVSGDYLSLTEIGGGQDKSRLGRRAERQRGLLQFCSHNGRG